MSEEKKFSPADLLLSNNVRTVDVEGLGVVSYIPLSTKETMEISSDRNLDHNGMNAKETWLMIKKANPDMMSFEEFVGDGTDGRATVSLIVAMLKERDFRV